MSLVLFILCTVYILSIVFRVTTKIKIDNYYLFRENKKQSSQCIYNFLFNISSSVSSV